MSLDDSGPGQYFTDDNRDGKTRNTTTGREVGSSDSSGRWKDSKAAGALRGAGAGLSAGSSALRSQAEEDDSRIGPVIYGYEKGGRVKRTGLARLHKGEYVVPRGKVKRVKKAMRRMKSGR